ncbi:UbiX family flavin prenyltransferase [Wolbachia endosymbiont of Howardula sp.]|uniref:UbiX family flavin prenyltransferase n=1 Tax=Wolbachia endosymbiont of Howardula sp. TaxID=2916816 RepID=UPI00217EB21F|nr:UbiX family flavin prenyltransferase [Wolbachia endosymbiont of Howardula sp.]UWI82995.1 UbiX family flavin prenyltransferase [Wolbachia endosymbiont of Howardula sp.]
MNNKIIIGISGASGAIYGLRILEILKEMNKSCNHSDVIKKSYEIHLVISQAGKMTLSHEVHMQLEDITSLADFYYSEDKIGARIASGSFKTLGMIIAPCSIKTMSEIASGVTTTLLTRAADVTLKERRKLIMMVRESPLHLGHLKNMLKLTEMGAIIAPPVPAFYMQPRCINDIINHSVNKVLDMFDITLSNLHIWQGI